MSDETQAGSVPGDIVESIAMANVKSVAEQPAMLANLALSNLIANVNLSQQNAVSNQQALNQICLTVVGKVVNLLTTLSPLEAMSDEKVLTGNAVAEEIADLKASLQALTGQTPGSGTAPKG